MKRIKIKQVNIRLLFKKTVPPKQQENRQRTLIFFCVSKTISIYNSLMFLSMSKTIHILFLFPENAVIFSRMFKIQDLYIYVCPRQFTHLAETIFEYHYIYILVFFAVCCRV